MRSQPRRYDIFIGEKDEQPLWIETMSEYDAAFARLQTIAMEKPGSYFIFCKRTGRILYAVNTAAPQGDPS